MSEPTNPEVFILNAALELPAEQRAAFLDQACADDAALRRQVDTLLKAHEQAGGFLKAPLADSGVERTLLVNIPLTEKPGDRIGRYKLLQQIGEGGCGVVYMAEQEEPVRRRVALKVIKLGMDTRSVIARFEAERQALALMDHPNIAKVLDAGATETGRPYFVMELVRGIKITDYCDQANLSTRERLDLFVQICRAIQHAHQKGIIHRDIKPSNILITVNDGVPVPKVIDFGIAKATQGRLTDKTLFTAFEQFIGTPAYMSPEQAEMTSLDIDTRSDIYSLGVLLYELLTGKTPFDANELFQAGLDEMRRTIREKEPQKPSTRLSTMLDAERKLTAKHRQTESPKLVHLVRGDLDWIAMKCLEKDRVRRYETANGLAADIQRHLNNEPVVARPPSAGYRTLKFIRRHKVGAAMGSAVILALMIGLVVSLAGFAQARRERDRAQAARNDAIGQKLRADQGAAENHRRLVLQYLANGNRAVESGDLFSALPWFGRALEVDQADPVQAEMHRLRIDTIIQQSPKLVALFSHNAAIRCAEFSPDGTRILTASSDGNSRVWNAANGEPITPFLHYNDLVLAARFSPDGRWVATAGFEGTVQIWNASTGERRIPPLLLKKPVRCLAFSSDGQWIVTGCENHTAQVWETATGKLCGPPLGQPQSVESVAFGHDNQSILTSTHSGTSSLWAWSPESPAKLSFQWDGGSPIFSPDGKRIALLQGGNSLRVYEAATGKQVLSTKVSAASRTLAFSPDGSKLLTFGDASQIWDAVSGSPITAPLRPSGGWVGSFSPDGRWVLISGADKSIRLLDAAGGEPVAALLKQVVFVRQSCFSPDGRQLLVGSEDGSVHVWDLAGAEIPSLPVKHPDLVYRIVFHPDSRRVLTVSLDGTAVFWELASGRKIESVLTNLNSVTAAEFSADGQRVAIGYDNGSAQIWNLISGAPVGPALHHSGTINHVEFSPDGARLVTAGADGLARVWRLSTGEMVAQMSLGRAVSYATFTPDGKKVVTASLNYWVGLTDDTGRSLHSPTNAFVLGTNAAVQVWDAFTGTSFGPPLMIDTPLSSVSLSPDRRYLVAACPELKGTNQVFIWDLTLQKPVALASPLTHASSVLNAFFSPDGKRVVTHGAEGTIRIWDAATGQRLTELLSVNLGGLAVFSPDGRLVLAYEAQRGPRLWDTSNGEPVSPPLPISGKSYLNRAMFSPDGRYIVVATGNGNVQSWEIPRSGRTMDDELRYAQMLSGGHVNEQESVSPLTRAQVSAARDELLAKYPSDFSVSSEQVFTWNRKTTEADVSIAEENIRAGRLDEARRLIGKIRETDRSLEYAAVLNDLVSLCQTMDKAKEAGDTQSMPVEALRTVVENLGLGYPSPVASAAEFLYSKGESAEAEKFFEDVIALNIVTAAESDFNVGYIRNGYGVFLLYREHKPEASLEQLHKALLIFRAWPERKDQLFWTLRELGDALVAVDRAKEGEPFLREALAISRKSHSDDKRLTPMAVISLAQNMVAQKRFSEAESSFQEALAIREQVYGVGSDEYTWGVYPYVDLLKSENKTNEIEALYRDALSKQPKVSINENTSVAVMACDLGDMLAGQKRNEEADVFYRRTLAALPKLRPDDLLKRSWMVGHFARLLYAQGKTNDAEKLCENLIAFQRTTYGSSSVALGDLYDGYGELLRLQEHKPEAAVEQYLKALPFRRATPNQSLSWTLVALGSALLDAGRFAEAEKYFREARDFDHKSGATPDVGMAWTLDGLARSLTAQKQFLEAEAIYHEELSDWEQLKGSGSNEYAGALTGLNEMLKAQGKPAVSTDTKH